MYEIYADGKLLFATRYAEDPQYQVFSPKVEFSDIGNAGTCSFIMPPGHPLYESLLAKKTNISVKANGKVLFKGRVGNITVDFYNQKEILCEGDLAYLSDSQVRPKKFTKKAADLFKYYISEHNKHVDPDRQFVAGTIVNDHAESKVELDESSFQDTKSAIDGNLISYYGGYLRTRDENGITYIDWIKEYGRESSQVINFGENLLDLSQSISPDGIFSVLIPIGQDGKTIASVNDGKDYLEVEGAVAKWGRIEKPVDFSNISDPAKLKQAGNKYISTNYDGTPLSLSITAVNLAHAGVNSDDIFIGDKVPIVSKPHGLNKKYTCVSVSYDLYYPDKTSFTFGKKIQELTRRYTQNAKSTSAAISEARSSAGRGTGGVASKLEKYITATDNTLMLQHDNIVLNAQNIEANAEQITLRATKEETNSLGKRISTVEIDLNGDDSVLGLKAELRQTVDGLGGLDRRLSQAEVDINGDEGTIGLKASVETNTEWLEDHDGNIKSLDHRMSSAEVNIDANKGEIDLKVNKDGVISSINQTSESVTINANRVNLNGYVTASELSAEIAEIKITESSYVTTAGLTTQSLDANYIDTNTLKVGSHQGKWKEVDYVKSVGRTKRYVKSPADVTIEIWEISSISNGTLYYFGY